jgi:DNA-binding GntR family transcriptional regulator
MPVPATSESRPRLLLRDDVYVRLRDAIVAGTLEPGERLRDADLAAWLGVSRTPVREALLRLQQNGLVVARPGSSTSVATLDTRTIRDAQAVVASMHELAVRQAVPRMTEQDLDRMRAANERFVTALRRGNVDAALAADDDFHAVPVTCAANDALRQVLDQFTPTLRRLERLRFASVNGRESVLLHQRLVDRCAAGDVVGAAAVSFETWQTLAPLLEADHAGPDQPDSSSV